jgi:hypothetical protein
MSRSFDDALATARERRRALTNTLGGMRARFSPPQLAEDVLGLIDPELELLHRARMRIQNNRLLSLAVLAGVGWLVGAPRRVNMKEKNNDSGQDHGDHWSGPGAGREEERRAQEFPEAHLHARRSRKAHKDGGIAPPEREPEQPGEERPQQP